MLSKVGVPLATIAEMHKHRTPQSVLALLTQQENKLDAQLYALQTAYSIIHTYRNTIEAGIAAADEREISTRNLDEAHIILGQVNNFSGEANFYGPFMRFCNMAGANKIDLHYPVGGYYENMQVFLDTPSEPTRFFSLDPRGNSKRKAGLYLVAYNKGYYGEFGDLPQRMLAHAQAHGLSLSGHLFILYLLDEISLADHNEYVSQIMVGVSKKR